MDGDAIPGLASRDLLVSNRMATSAFPFSSHEPHKAQAMTDMGCKLAFDGLRSSTQLVTTVYYSCSDGFRPFTSCWPG